MGFIKVKCKNCGHEQICNERPACIVKCRNCRVTMQKPRGGKGNTRGIIVERLK